MMSFKKKAAVAITTLGVTALVMGLAGCGASKSSSNAEAFKIGGIGPISGPAAVYGEAVKNSTELAIDEINKAGGINGYPVEFKFEDDEHDPEKSVNAYNTLKDWGMQVLVGTVTTGPCLGVADKTFQDNMFQMTPSGSAVEVTAHPNVFRTCFSDPQQGELAAKYIASNQLAKKVAVIYDSSDVYSNGIAGKFEEVAKQVGLDVVAAEAFTSENNKDFSTQLQKAKSAGATLVLLPIYYTEASLLLQQAQKMDYKPTFFGCDGLDGILSIKNYDMKLTDGVMLMTPFSADAKDENIKKFVDAYKEKYKTTPNQFGADAYDTVFAIKAAAEKSKLTPKMSVSEISDALKKSMCEITIDGLTGKGMSWNEGGDVNKEPKVVVIKDGKYEELGK